MNVRKAVTFPPPATAVTTTPPMPNPRTVAMDREGDVVDRQEAVELLRQSLDDDGVLSPRLGVGGTAGFHGCHADYNSGRGDKRVVGRRTLPVRGGKAFGPATQSAAMERVTVDEVDPKGLERDVDARVLTDALGTTDVAINHYRIPPDGGFPSGLHAHVDQEEVFVVLDGEATFLTPDGTISVEAGEVIRFAPGEFQTGRNEGDDELVALALGAPRDTEDVRIPVTCPACGHGDVRPEGGDDGVELVCPACGTGHVPQGCPECGRDEMTVLPGEDRRTVVTCPNCGTELDSPRFAE
ncbi:MAG: cupin domain-containing protein [archaeon]